MPREYCAYCGFKLTALEKHYYTYGCEHCTREEHERLEAWRNGAPDKTLYERYGIDARPHPFDA